MTTARRGGLVAALLLPAWAAGGAGAVDDTRHDVFVRATADPALVERALRDTGVEREPPQPSFGAYVGHVAERLSRFIAERLTHAADVLQSSGVSPRVVAWGVVALAGLALAWALVGALVGRRAAVRPVPAVTTRPAAPGEGMRLREREEWRRELEARLERGDAAAALEALWWWLARSLSGAAVQSSWTSRELLAHAGRLDLAPLAASLDRLLYGSARPGVDDVRRLAGRMQAVLP